MRTRAVFGLLAIVVLGVAGWVGPAFASADFLTAQFGQLSIVIDPAFPEPLVPTVSSTISSSTSYSPVGANATALPAVQEPILQASAAVQGTAGAPGTFANASATATINWALAYPELDGGDGGPIPAPPSQPVLLTLSVSSGFGTIPAVTALGAGDFAQVSSSVHLTGLYVDGLGGSVAFDQLLSFCLASDGSCSNGPPVSFFGGPLMLNLGGSLDLHLTVHAEGVARAGAVASAPMPATLALLGSGLTALGTLAWRRRR